MRWMVAVAVFGLSQVKYNNTTTMAGWGIGQTHRRAAPEEINGFWRMLNSLPHCRAAVAAAAVAAERSVVCLPGWTETIFFYIYFSAFFTSLLAAAFCSGQKINFLSLQFSSSLFLTSSNSCEYFSSLCSGLLFFCRLPHTRCFFCFKNLIKSSWIYLWC